MLYFGYGSNLDPRQMRRRCPSAVLVARAHLANHRLVFGGFSRSWGGGVASVEPSQGDHVEGAIYRINKADVRTLDRCEGVPFAYIRTRRTVQSQGGRKVRAWTYILQAEERTPPTRRYVHRIASGYVALGLNLKHLVTAVKSCLDGRTR